jgi:hypothetical protein
MLLGEAAPLLLRHLEGVEKRIGVVAHAARVVIEDRLEGRQPLADLQELVDLLLVFGHGEARLGMLEHELHLGGDRILIDRDGNAAQALRRGHRPIEPRAVVADDREPVAAPEAQRGQAVRQVLHFLRGLTPTPGLPDAEILLADRRVSAVPRRMVEQKLGKRVERVPLRGPIRNFFCRQRHSSASGAGPVAQAQRARALRFLLICHAGPSV